MCYENVRVILTWCCATKNFQALGAAGTSSSKAGILTPKSEIKCLGKIGPYWERKISAMERKPSSTKCF